MTESPDCQVQPSGNQILTWSLEEKMCKVAARGVIKTKLARAGVCDTLRSAVEGFTMCVSGGCERATTKENPGRRSGHALRCTSEEAQRYLERKALEPRRCDGYWRGRQRAHP